jgi:hypothetical protein
VQVQPHTENDIHLSLAATDAAGLYAAVDYEARINIADAMTAEVPVEAVALDFARRCRDRRNATEMSHGGF